MAPHSSSNILSKRLYGLVAAIREQKPDFQEDTLKDAVSWSRDRLKSRKIPIKHDEFSDPLVIAEKLVEFAGDKIDSTTILASILYPSVRPKEGHRVDESGMQDIENKFGRKVHDLVRRTLQFRALDKIDLAPESTRTQKEHTRDFQLMGLWVAEDPRAILIRATQFAISLGERAQHLVENIDKRMANDAWGNGSHIPNAAWMQKAKEVMAPLAYIAGWSKLKDSILNDALRVENPRAYANAARQIGTAERLNANSADTPIHTTLIKEDDLPHFRVQITEMMDKLGYGPSKYTLEMNSKKPHSAHSKAEKKNQDVAQLGDRQRFRIILHSTAVEGDHQMDESALSKVLGDEIHKMYAAFSKEHGRGNKRDPQFRRAYANLALIDPDPKNPGHDARYDDYITTPKKKSDGSDGYSAKQDTIFLRHKNGTLVEFEAQFVDELRHRRNSYDPEIGHFAYKAGLGEKAPLAEQFQMYARDLLQDNPSRRKSVFVYGAHNEIFHVPDGTLGGYVATTQDKNALNGHTVRAVVDNVDPFYPRERTLSSPEAPLRNGDRIVSLELTPRP